MMASKASTETSTNGGRGRGNESKPPAHLSPDAGDEWARCYPLLIAAKALRAVDRAILAAYCQAYGRWCQAERSLSAMAVKDERNYALMVKTASGNPIHNPLVGIANKSMADMAIYAAQLGMTPASRAKVVLAETGEPQGKKAQQAAAAVTAQAGTDWETLLTGQPVQ